MDNNIIEPTEKLKRMQEEVKEIGGQMVLSRTFRKFFFAAI